MPSWCGAEVKAQGQLYLYLYKDMENMNLNNSNKFHIPILKGLPTTKCRLLNI
jgi:hypothetical protein